MMHQPSPKERIRPVAEDAAAQTVNNWATNIDDGDPEVTQILTLSL